MEESITIIMVVLDLIYALVGGIIGGALLFSGMSIYEIRLGAGMLLSAFISGMNFLILWNK